MISMIAIVGGPTTWMVLNNVGAARTELAVVTMAANYAGVEIGAADMGSGHSPMPCGPLR